jgi:hypothetical protein
MKYDRPNRPSGANTALGMENILVQSQRLNPRAGDWTVQMSANPLPNRSFGISRCIQGLMALIYPLLMTAAATGNLSLPSTKYLQQSVY